MNKHFQDTQYYLKRAGETAKAGVSEEIEPVQQRVTGLIDREDEAPEPSRFDGIRRDFDALRWRVGGETRETIRKARKLIKRLRTRRTEA